MTTAAESRLSCSRCRPRQQARSLWRARPNKCSRSPRRRRGRSARCWHRPPLRPWPARPPHPPCVRVTVLQSVIVHRPRRHSSPIRPAQRRSRRSAGATRTRSARTAAWPVRWIVRAVGGAMTRRVWLGVVEYWRLHLHPLRRRAPRPGRTHLQGNNLPHCCSSRSPSQVRSTTLDAWSPAQVQVGVRWQRHCSRPAERARQGQRGGAEQV